MLSAKKVAEYFLSLSDEDLGDMISNLKLQKLCYYAQGFSLALYNKPLFKEEIVAWNHGPVVPELYREYKEYGANGIPVPNVDLTKYTKEEKELMNEVYTVYGQFSAWKLVNMTHSEAPWRDANINEVISIESMKLFFDTLVD